MTFKYLWAAPLALALAVSAPAMATDENAEGGGEAKEKLICRTELATGSRVKKRRICMTQEQWRETAAKSRRTMDDLNNNRGAETGGGGGGALNTDGL